MNTGVIKMEVYIVVKVDRFEMEESIDSVYLSKDQAEERLNDILDQSINNSGYIHRADVIDE
jgi:hypothetical protein